MEELTKTQLILLALLVSFVTSIATGIATVALMDQAPADVTRVINRVVERTVEKVTPTEQGASVITKEKTVIVKEEDALTKAIDTISSSLARLYGGVGVSRTFLGMAVVVTAEGHLIADSDVVTFGKTYEVVLPQGISIAVEAIAENKAHGIAVLKVIPAEGAEIPSLLALVPTKAPMKLGQTVFTVSGEKTPKVATGIVTGLPTNTTGQINDIEINIPTSDFMTGTPLGNLFGEVIGIARSTASQRFIPIQDVMTVVRVTVEGAPTAGGEVSGL